MHNTHIHMHACAQYTYTYSFYKLLPYTNTLCSTKKKKRKKKEKKTILKIVFGEYGAATTNMTTRNTLSPVHCTQHVSLQTPCLQCEWLFNEANSKLDVKLGAIFHQHVREHCVYTSTTVKLESTL